MVCFKCSFLFADPKLPQPTVEIKQSPPDESSDESCPVRNTSPTSTATRVIPLPAPIYRCHPPLDPTLESTNRAAFAGHHYLGPFPPPSPLDTAQESAAKLLFFAVRWMRGVPSFLQLSFRDQAILLEEAWSDVFVLSAAQWGFPLQEGKMHADIQDVYK